MLFLVFKRKIFEKLYSSLLRELSEIVSISKITTLRIILFTLRFLQFGSNESVFSCIWTEYRNLLRKSPYSVQIQETTDQK